MTLILFLTMPHKKIIVIGGGFFGLYLSRFLNQIGYKVKLFEAEAEPMQHASYNNQARVHQGYHYPRSVLTALRSRETFSRFIQEFPECIYKDFVKYYLVGKPLGKVSASQFYSFFKRIGAPISRADGKIFDLVNPNYVEDCFLTQEFAFDSVKLKKAMLYSLSETSVEILYEHKALKVERVGNENLVTILNVKTNEVTQESALHVFNCTYSALNFIPRNSGFDIIPLKHELTEMAVVRVPEIFQNMGITLMCGPFFSVMPFPSLEENGVPLHSFSHVRYTPHYEWYDSVNTKFDYGPLHEKRNSAWKYLLNDAKRYIPALSQCIYKSSLWEIKTVLPRSETDDSRPIFCKFNHGVEGFHCLMGGKIDNIYDAVTAVSRYLRGNYGEK